MTLQSLSGSKLNTQAPHHQKKKISNLPRNFLYYKAQTNHIILSFANNKSRDG